MEKERVELIDLFMPDPDFLRSVPDAPAHFGKHLTVLSYDPKYLNILLTADAPEKKCGGILEVRAIGKEQIQHLGRGEPIEAHCSRCSFRLGLAENTWDEAILEWMRICFACGLEDLLRLRSPRSAGFLAYSDSEPSLKSLLPSMQKVDNTVVSYLSEERWMTNCLLPVWYCQRFVVAKLEGMGTPDGMVRWGVIAAILMKNMEDRFQQGIKRAASFAASASEPFHLERRRY